MRTFAKSNPYVGGYLIIRHIVLLSSKLPFSPGDQLEKGNKGTISRRGLLFATGFSKSDRPVKSSAFAATGASAAFTIIQKLLGHLSQCQMRKSAKERSLWTLSLH